MYKNLKVFSICLITAFLTTTAQAQTINDGYFTGADGHQLYYRSVGNSDDVIVYLHGGPGFDMNDGGLEFDNIGDGRMFLTYDQRGGGNSEIVTDPKDLTWQDHVEDLEVLRQTFNIDKLTLVGQSWGCGLAILYASVYPENVERFVLLSPMTMTEDMWAYRAQRENALIDPQGLQRFGDILGIDPFSISDQEVVALCREYLDIIFIPYLAGTPLSEMNGDYCGTHPDGLRVRWMNSDATWSSFAGWDWRPIAQQLQVPALIFDGALTGVPKNTTREWAYYFPNSRFFFQEGAGHLTWLDRPDEVHNAINTFLSGTWPENARRMDELKLDLLSQYSFNENANNNSDNHQHGTITGNVQYSSDRFNEENTAIKFKNNAKVTVEEPMWYPYQVNWSWSAWINFKSNNDRDLLIHGDTKLWSDQGRLTFTHNSLQIAAPEKMSKSEWHHVAVVRNGNTFTLYQDGVEVGQQVTGDTSVPAGDFIMMNNQGHLDDVRVYARSLSDADITALRYYVNE